MATKLTKPVRREVEVPGHATMIVTLELHGVSFRPKGRRLELTLPYPRAVLQAAKLKAEETVAERRARRKGRR
jgi:hypothetical protein